MDKEVPTVPDSHGKPAPLPCQSLLAVASAICHGHTDSSGPGATPALLLVDTPLTVPTLPSGEGVEIPDALAIRS